ncbi:MAG: NAD(P)-dependent oxidoreductase, partial [Actinobacteria bacterium]|nr:NAD(P)-dependent oxidoreductase [Actinomycetota bacterium]NIS36257.1 NAD(P)-dependent oxidoreductase [Actinomycetota bacterium]NIT94559.1 NAD(P)-dependent oxidoreductase [Actinomycetota bacterium]NIU70809.1 NAD(P)-dependent oxidoreductase [Actinomycetota bacterium]NIV90376.1 NAD(P)-dependent oxidoreductase [Actinomycetota bacterium]
SEPIDITVEATGIPEVGARVAHQAILARKHVLQMNVEADATVGYLLRRMANAAGVVYTLT